MTGESPNELVSPSHSSSFSASGLNVYFQSKRAGLEAQLAERLAEFIHATRESLDCAIYDLRHPTVLQALVQAAQRGVKLRIAFDGGKARTGGLGGDPKPDGTQEAIQNAGLGQYATAVHEKGRHLMHDKFLVRDGRSLWMGSANFTVGGLELQDNNCLAIESPQLAADYSATFAGLLTGETGQTPPDGQTTHVGEIALTPFFAPAAKEGIENAIDAALKRAKKLRVLAFLISDPGALDALAPYASDPNFDIRGVYDPNGMNDVLRYTKQDPARFWFTKDPRFVRAPTHAFSPAHEQDFMHNKVIIVDDSLVITGSYNFSENAEANDENVLAIQSPALATAYTAYFDTLYTAYSAARPKRLTEVAFVGGIGATVGVARLVADESSSAAPAQAETHPVKQTEEHLMATPQSSSGPRAHVLSYPGRGSIAYEQITLQRSRASFGGEQQVGQTANVIVYTDGTPQGNQSAQAVLSSFDNDYSVITAYFGGLRLPQGQQGDDKTVPRTALPVQVLMDGQAGGAYHFGCSATDLYCEPTPDAAEGFAIAELVEVFEAAINNGWQCGQTNGEALSRVLATDRAPILGQIGVQAGQAWWADGHQDFITTNSATDQNNDSNGCGPLFLFYLHSQLHFDWKTITTTGGATLGETYQRLTGNSPQQGLQDFLSRLATVVDASGTLAIPPSGNPFPIGATTTPPPSAPGNSGGVTAPAIPVTVGGGSPVLLTAVIVVIVLLIILGAVGALGGLHF